MKNVRTISKIGRETKILDVSDNLRVNTFFSDEGGVFESTVHSKYSRINFTLVDTTAGKKDKAKVFSFNLKVEEFEIFKKYFVSFNPEEYKKNSMLLNKKYFGKSDQNYSFMKINPYVKKQQGKLELMQVSVFSVVYESNPQYRAASKWKLQFETGWAIGEEKGAKGGHRLVPKNYKREKGSLINVTADELQKVIEDVTKYIPLWESYVYPKMMTYRDAFEKRYKNNNSDDSNIEEWNTKIKRHTNVNAQNKTNTNEQNKTNTNEQSKNNTNERKNIIQQQKLENITQQTQKKPVLTEVPCAKCKTFLTEEEIASSIAVFAECLCTKCVKEKQMAS